jgi:hypothetical protein
MYDYMAMKCYVLFILGSAKPHSGITRVSATRGVDDLGNRVVPSANDRGAIGYSLDKACGRSSRGHCEGDFNYRLVT